MIKKRILLSMVIGASFSLTTLPMRPPLFDLQEADINGEAAHQAFPLVSASNRNMSAMFNFVPTPEVSQANAIADVLGRAKAERVVELAVTPEDVVEEIQHELLLAKETIGQKIEADVVQEKLGQERVLAFSEQTLNDAIKFGVRRKELETKKQEAIAQQTFGLNVATEIAQSKRTIDRKEQVAQAIYEDSKNFAVKKLAREIEVSRATRDVEVAAAIEQQKTQNAILLSTQHLQQPRNLQRLETNTLLALGQQPNKVFHSLLLLRAVKNRSIDRYTLGSLLASYGVGFVMDLPSVQMLKFGLMSKANKKLEHMFYSKEQLEKMKKERSKAFVQKHLQERIKTETALNNLAISEEDKNEREMNNYKSIIENNDPAKTSDPEQKIIRTLKRSAAEKLLHDLECKVLGIELSPKNQSSPAKTEQQNRGSSNDNQPEPDLD